MRQILLAMLLAAGLGLAGTAGASAAPVSPGVIGDAADAALLVESVHCRRYLHAHPGWHRWGTGCYRPGIYFYGGPRHGHWRWGSRGGHGRWGGGGRPHFRGGMHRGGGRVMGGGRGGRRH